MQRDPEQVYDIAKVCQMLGTTSRTLRFYQQKGIIESTATPFSSRRQYTAAQVEKIRNVLALRTLGLSVKTIGELQKNDTDLKTALLQRKAQMIAAINAKQKEIHTLNEALALLKEGSGECGGQAPMTSELPSREDLAERACICANAVLEGKTEVLYAHLTPQLISYMPREVYERVRRDTLAPLGKLISMDGIARDPQHDYIYYAHATYEYLNLCIKMVFCCHLIGGLWLTYDSSERSQL